MLGLASLGSGYGFDQLMIYSLLPLAVILLLPFVKILATSLTLGSGGAGVCLPRGLPSAPQSGAALGDHSCTCFSRPMSRLERSRSSLSLA